MVKLFFKRRSKSLSRTILLGINNAYKLTLIVYLWTHN